MKRFLKTIIPAIVFIIALASCATTKKVEATTHQIRADTTHVEEHKELATTTTIDTTRTEQGKVTITEIVFETSPCAAPDTTTADKGQLPIRARPETPVASVDLPGIGLVQGNIKSIRQTVIENNVEVKGQSTDSNKQKESKSNANATRTEENNTVKEQPAPDPNRWKYISFIIAAALIVLLYLKRVPILEWVKRILSGLRRIF